MVLQCVGWVEPNSYALDVEMRLPEVRWNPKMDTKIVVKVVKTKTTTVNFNIYLIQIGHFW